MIEEGVKTILIFSSLSFHHSGTTVRTAGWLSALRRTSTTPTRRPCGATRTSTCSSGWRPMARSSTPREAGGGTSTATSCHWWCNHGEWTTVVMMTVGGVQLDDALTEGQGQERQTRGMTCGYFTESRWTKDISIFKKKDILLYNVYIISSLKLSSTWARLKIWQGHLCQKKEKGEKLISKLARLVCTSSLWSAERETKREEKRRSDKRKIDKVTTKQHSSESNTSLFCQDCLFKIIYCVIFNKTIKKKKKRQNFCLWPFMLLFWILII